MTVAKGPAWDTWAPTVSACLGCPDLQPPTSMGEAALPRPFGQAASGVEGQADLSAQPSRENLPDRLQLSYSQVGVGMGAPPGVRPGARPMQYYHVPPPFIMPTATLSLPQRMPVDLYSFRNRPSPSESRPNSAPAHGAHYSSWGYPHLHRASSGVRPRMGQWSSNFLHRSFMPEEATDGDSGGLPLQASSTHPLTTSQPAISL
ncbi:uncharacterized protein LOC142355568 [Convolutriloba macropyga]|uniref:uncharacterized protein LOC142355568 n=1 Tax=Convolutriloba macropyga TaxID=536237 RepID=UPI003F5248E7